MKQPICETIKLHVCLFSLQKSKWLSCSSLVCVHRLIFSWLRIEDLNWALWTMDQNLTMLQSIDKIDKTRDTSCGPNRSHSKCVIDSSNLTWGQLDIEINNAFEGVTTCDSIWSHYELYIYLRFSESYIQNWQYHWRRDGFSDPCALLTMTIFLKAWPPSGDSETETES